MGQTIRQRINNALLAKDERLLRKFEVVDSNGLLTDVGRRIVLDRIFEDKAVRKQVVDHAQLVDDEEKASK